LDEREHLHIWKAMLSLSSMESVHEAQAALAVAERASAAPYVDYPPTPKWYPFVVGAWCALMVLALHGLSTDTAVFVPVVVALVAAEGAFIAWYRRYRKTMPTLRNAPPEINAAFRRYFAGCVAVLAVCAGTWVLLGPAVCAAVTFVLVSAGLWRYEHDYAAARQRLSP
jgi:hypothetical protein